MLPRRIFLSWCFALTVAGCAVTSTGTVVIDGRANKVELVEHAPNGILLEGYDVYINSEFVGRAARLGNTNPLNRRTTVSFAPVQTEYGTVGLTQNINTALVGSEITFDITINGEYAGSVQMPSI